jgi:hypothetical protein
MKVLVLASLVGLVAFAGCQNPIGSDQGGTLMVSLNDAVSRSILPGLSMNPASYDLAGTGPNGGSFSQTVTNGSSATIADLAFGDWTVTATAKNSDGTAIGQGSGTVTVLSNASVSLALTVRPYDGFGTLSLNVSWPAAQVQTAQIQSSLTPATGTARTLAFTVNGNAGTASFSASDVATGYHTLVLKLLDNGHLAIGAVEVVRIVKDQTTSGTLAFANVNQATGTLEVNLTPEMADPLDVSISGSAATKPANQSLALSAAVSNYSDNVTYVWYVNGDAVATGASYTFGDTWVQGYYRIDVTAFSADGKRAGSSTKNMQVTSAELIDGIYTSPNIGVLVYVPAGEYQGKVVNNSFRMSQYEITRAQYLSIVGTDPSDASASSGINDPVQRVNIYDAMVFCNKLSIRENLTPVYSINGSTDPNTWGPVPRSGDAVWNAAIVNLSANGYKVPTSIEWTWAAMDANSGNYNIPFSGSDGTNKIGDYAVFGYGFALEGATTTPRTNPVGSKLPNRLGLYDMTGNVYEWMYDSQYELSYNLRYAYGGSWSQHSNACRITPWDHADIGFHGNTIGFRVIKK